MTPYGDFLYFGVLLYVVVPTFILGLSGRAGRRWILLATVAMLAVQYGDHVRIDPGVQVREIWIVVAFALFQWAIAATFLRLRAHTNHRGLFYVALALSLLPLIVAKYVPVVAPSFQFGFLGISYVTFRALDVIICTQDRLITSLPPSQFFISLFFFATISAGPIDRYRRFAADWTHRRTRREFLGDADEAVHRLFIGFFYKFIIAALIQHHWLDPAASASGFVGTLSFMYAYSLYLFFDFAGYSAFAIGISYLLGVHTPENFDRPFLAHNIRDFWNRWHMTLSAWLRDHVYMRFVMAATKGRWFQNRYVASYLGFVLAFGLMGLWHGPAIHYLLYGLYHGALLSVHDAFGRWNKQHGLWGDGPLWRAAGIFGTFHCVCFGFLLFSGHLTGGARPDDTAADANAYEGRFEKADCDEIAGWAWDAKAPDRSVDVDVYADGVRLATVAADLFRPDLAAAGKGNGAHAFVFVTPPELKDGWAHAITTKISGADIELTGPPVTIVCVRSAKSMDGYDGVHDPGSCGQITGWAWDMTAPERAVDVDIYDENNLLATVTADQLREGLPDGQHGSGRHGFAYDIPATLRDGRPHSISVRLSGSNVALRHTPQILDCGGAPAAAPVSEHAGAAAPLPTSPPLPNEREATPTALPTLKTPRAYTDNGDGTITDLTTGLMWEKKIKLDSVVDATDLNDADNCYPWAGKCAAGEADCRIDTDCGSNGPCRAVDCQAPGDGGMTIFAWIAQLNARRYAGHNDWRLPNSQEIYSIVNPIEESDPAANAAFNGASCGTSCARLADPACSCNQPGLYWAAPATGPKPDESWMMFFYCNGHLFLDLKSNRFFVRAVRSG